MENATTRFKISSDPVAAKEIISLIREHQGCSYTLTDGGSNLSGVEIVNILADLTTIASNALTLWISARPHLRSTTRIEKDDYISRDTVDRHDSHKP
ncbi:hypothetical protein KQX62_17990 [Rhodopseudomonas palustris]|uniref:Uncharacterized protein n=1 Tax=Rhodopseudomonas palustris TaxID=1076 RepID=A0AAX3DUQ9_RHOPL|nr:hypothetical protein [Rhodopseudomonas palustris]UYO38591.1 hypothetical protein KQX62_17990 [Rhodopseudomonas palustris]